ncbi:MAG: hypothetical protein A2725_02085 [Candidatus Magasanikbacteria bacterium RIFCSPHIGHO2_01_FULL_33_34]|uniref:Methyltransferase domain-containing protein n=1 Tax=Candidatus Magasanikbacteria bacterium RIFCSPHIGHO2_01_FULL_33_34 TaxID=1798671 RepID=A0A1F6LKE4_9BACT|nr:MAG: hypothetical protein A2725_02085 [Candidatus Magasanikbacteria bacterium RIFCSPHIGHO2_01_FULL_33_34]OGH65557.1 MAG: hypothetical protein A3B83_01660 [Candidatus Magasanikbacteria bacterium RIFCSPHIGHO2_02_FULL_33_17]OGH76267.1 MAG: hypothetical protein A3A89_02480 [Candidatus Magasanikbacteria bacterium RIFCSPLOWO2_01_FULL_33_34]OGH81118.1 MAG: hypothetical protein A3F93_00145 [Candidatus Magasanikbacteria bacterium RIFCSPLOWO2_12_FULL_34_7]
MYSSGNKLINPQLLFEKVRLQSNMHIADFGCGKTGQIVFTASKIIGENGIIYAVDILQEDLGIVEKRAKLNNQTNIHTIWSDVEQVGKTSIPAKSLDVIFMVNILNHTTNTDNPLNEAKRLLKEKARIIVADWKHNHGLSIGPTENKTINFEKIIQWANNNNFAVQEKFEAGKYHNGIVLFRHD